MLSMKDEDVNMFCSDHTVIAVNITHTCEQKSFHNFNRITPKDLQDY